MTTDPIADLLTRIRNVNIRKQESTNAPYAKIKEQILAVLKKEGFIMGYQISEDEAGKKFFQIKLKYINGKPMIHQLERVSKPGVRKYTSYKNIKKVKRGLGISILTTSKGVMTGEQARKEKTGGEIICKIW